MDPTCHIAGIRADVLVCDAGGAEQNVLHMTFQQCRHMNQQHTRRFFQLKQWRYVLRLLVWKVWQNASLDRDGATAVTELSSSDSGALKSGGNPLPTAHDVITLTTASEERGGGQ